MRKFIHLVLLICLSTITCFANSESESVNENLDNQFSIGVGHYRSKDYTNALLIFKKLSNKGHAKSQYLLGYMFLQGQGQQQDMKRAYYWLNESAKKEFAAAQYLVAGFYLDGTGVDQDAEEAFSWALKAAKQGFVDAQALVSNLYLNGNGVEKSDNQALGWAQEAAKQGHVHSQFVFGYMIYKGIGFESRPDIGEYWLRMASSRGHIEAMLRLSRLLVEKKRKNPLSDAQLTEEEKKNLCSGKESKIWLEIAALLEHPEALTRKCIYTSDSEGPAYSWIDGYGWCKLAIETGTVTNEEYKKLINEGLNGTVERLSKFDMNKAKLRFKKLINRKAQFELDYSAIEKEIESCKKEELAYYSNPDRNKPISFAPKKNTTKRAEPIKEKELASLQKLFQGLKKRVDSNSGKELLQQLTSFDHPAREFVLPYLSVGFFSSDHFEVGLDVHALIEDPTLKGNVLLVAYYLASKNNKTQPAATVFQNLRKLAIDSKAPIVQFRALLDDNQVEKAQDLIKKHQLENENPFVYSALLTKTISLGRFDKAVELINSIPKKEVQALFYNDLAIAYAKVGKPEKSLEIIGKVEEVYMDWPLKHIASAFAISGNLVDAIKTAESMPDKHKAFVSYGEIAGIAASYGEEKIVNELLGRINDESTLQTAIAEVVKGFAKSGEVEKASQLIKKVTEYDTLEQAQIALIKAYIEKNQLKNALKTAGQINRRRAYVRVNANLEIFKYLKKSGKKHEAMTLLKETISVVTDIGYSVSFKNAIFDVLAAENNNQEILKSLFDIVNHLHSDSMRWEILTTLLFYKHFRNDFPVLFQQGIKRMERYLREPTAQFSPVTYY